MKNGRFKRNFFQIVMGAGTFCICLIINYCPATINNYTEVLSGVLSFTSVATAMLFSAFALIPLISQLEIGEALLRLHTDKKFMDRLLITTVLFFLVAMFSMVSLLFRRGSSGFFSHIILSCWLSFLVSACSEIISMLRAIFAALDKFDQQNL